MDALRAKWEAAKNAQPSEAQRFFQQAELLHKQGNPRAAKEMLSNLIDVFGEVAAEKAWVQRARRALNDLEQAGAQKDRFQSAEKALERARELHAQGKHRDAERILVGIEALYRNDPGADEILTKAKQAREKK